jgi:hypothetical protein
MFRVTASAVISASNITAEAVTLNKENWRKRQDSNLQKFSLDGLANRDGYRFITFPH